MADRARRKDWIWDRYWQADRIASCFDGAGATNYPLPLAKPWLDLFGGLPDGAAVLDLCTGNGAIPLLAVEAARAAGLRFRITGVDRANVDPAAHVPRLRPLLQAIDFRSGIPAEKLPFPDAAFDAVTSQYGIEYTDTARSTREAGRVARPGARLRCVVHAADGGVAETSRAHIAEIRWLESLDLPARTAKAITLSFQAERSLGIDRSPAQAAVAVLSAALARVRDALPRLHNPAMARIAVDVLADCYARRDFRHSRLILGKVAEVGTELAAHRGRLEALVAAALDAEGTRSLVERFAAAGFVDLAVEDVTGPDGIRVGRMVTGTRSAA